MGDRVVVHSTSADAEDVRQIVDRLTSRGVEVIEEQPHMLLVAGTKAAIGRALADARGWEAAALTMIEHPRTRERVLKPPR